MAVTFNTTTKYNPQTERGERLETPEVENIFPAGTVLSVTNYTYHVPSDNAMIDSGNGRRVRAFVNGRVVTREFSEGRDMCGYYTMEPDANDETRALAARWDRWATWFASLATTDYQNKKAAREFLEVNVGARVEVVKGRKVKKGTVWFVHKRGEGDYGPYVHLSSDPRGIGEYVRFVNPENLRVVDDVPAGQPYHAAPNGHNDATLVSLAKAYNGADHTCYGWRKPEEQQELDAIISGILAALADRCEELGDDDGAACFHLARK